LLITRASVRYVIFMLWNMKCQFWRNYYLLQ
jgi:hypothetical protein